MISVAQAIDAESVPVTLRTLSAGAYSADGKWVPGAASDTPIRASIQPPSGRVLQDLPEGIRADVSYVGWSRISVALTDEIIYGDSNFRVIHVWPRPTDGFVKFAMARIKVD